MKFTEEQLLLQKTAREFAENEVRPRIAEIIENEGFIPRDLYKRMGELGFLGIMVKKEYGGLELGMKELCLVTEELSKVAPTLGLILMCVGPGLPGIQDVPAIREAYLADCVSGRKVFDGAVTAPEGHTNTSEWSVMAKKVDGGYILNGTKLFVTNAADVDVHQVFCFDEERHMRIFTIPGDAEGFNHDAHEVKFGMKGSGGGTCTYHDVFVADDMVVDGEVGGGEFYNNIWLQCATIALGAMEGALDQAISYAKQRTFDFKPVASIQAQAQRIAKLKCSVVACNSLIYDACSDYEDADTLQDAYLKSQVAKAFVPTVAFEVTRECMKLHGGLGYSDVRIYHYFADAVAGAIMDQTTEFLLESIAHMIDLSDELN